jgi:soluble cytochrome b562
MARAMEHLRSWPVVALGLVLALLAMPSTLTGSEQATIEELKGRVADASVSERPGLCIHISERQLDAANRFYDAGDSEKAKAALADVVAFSGLARDSAIQSRKHEKQSEIAIRKMARKLADMKHAVSHEDQEQVENTIEQLQRIRDDLLAAMFPKGVKK